MIRYLFISPFKRAQESSSIWVLRALQFRDWVTAGQAIFLRFPSSCPLLGQTCGFSSQLALQLLESFSKQYWALILGFRRCYLCRFWVSLELFYRDIILPPFPGYDRRVMHPSSP